MLHRGHGHPWMDLSYLETLAEAIIGVYYASIDPLRDDSTVQVAVVASEFEVFPNQRHGSACGPAA